MELLKDLELIEVAYENDNKKAILTFLDAEQGEIREVNFNKQVFGEDGKFKDDPEKAAKVDEWCQEYFELPFSDLTKAIGVKKDVYAYDTFNSLWESAQVLKQPEDMVGQILNVECTDAFDDGNFLKIQYEYEGNTYESKMGYSKYLEATRQWLVNPQKREKQYQKFQEKFGIPVADIKDLVGQNLMVEVKTAFGKPYSEVKAFPKKKKQ